MKNKIFVLVLVAVVLASSSVLAHQVEKTKTVEEILAEITREQNVVAVSQIDCNKVSNLQFEDLGDAVMERMVGSHEQHEQMDAMMGGEGSASLVQMHTIMGKNWLSCNNLQGMMVVGMTGTNMMPMMMRMMGNYYPAYYSRYDSLLVFTLIGWALAIILLVVLLIFSTTGKLKFRKRRIE